jgi:hypothetical protein
MTKKGPSMERVYDIFAEKSRRAARCYGLKPPPKYWVIRLIEPRKHRNWLSEVIESENQGQVE